MVLGRDVVFGVGLLLGRLVFFTFVWIRRVLSFPLLGASGRVLGNEIVDVISGLGVAPILLERRRPPFRHAMLICPPYIPLQQASIVV